MKEYTREEIIQQDNEMKERRNELHTKLLKMSKDKLLTIKNIWGFDGSYGFEISIDESMRKEAIAQEIIDYTTRQIKIDLLLDFMGIE